MADERGATNGSQTTAFDTIYNALTSTYGFPVLPAKSPNPHNKDLSHKIAELSMHPTLESILHILNSDLPSAHFLCRHMQNDPAWEGMYIHGILHRVEGDLENAKAWYGDVSEKECYESVWGKNGLDDGKDFLDRSGALRQKKGGDADAEMAALSELSQKEFNNLTEFCKQRFGAGVMTDATQAWAEPSEELREIAAKMLVGGEGWRQF